MVTFLGNTLETKRLTTPDTVSCPGADPKVDISMISRDLGSKTIAAIRPARSGPNGAGSPSTRTWLSGVVEKSAVSPVIRSRI